jgi:hypothetical protein
MGTGINTFEEALDLPNVVVYPHVNNCAAKPFPSFGPSDSRRSPIRKPRPRSLSQLPETCIQMPFGCSSVLPHLVEMVS